MSRLTIISAFVFCAQLMFAGMSYVLSGGNLPLAILSGCATALVIALLVWAPRVFARTADSGEYDVFTTSLVALAAAGPLVGNWGAVLMFGCPAIVGYREYKKGCSFFGSFLTAFPFGIGAFIGGMLYVFRNHLRHI